MSSSLSRRQLLNRTAGVAISAAAAASIPTVAHADTASAAPANNATVPIGTALIAVSDASYGWPGLSGVANHDASTSLQGIAFDSSAQHLYTLQVAGASQVAYLQSSGQIAVTAAISGDQHSVAGDLVLSQHDLVTGAVTGSMYLLGFGHGVSLGVEPASDDNPPYVWTEANSGPSGFGSEVVRFPFVNATVLWTSAPSVQRLPSPDPNATAIIPSVDVTNNLLVLRYALPGSGQWFGAYDLTEARAAAIDTAAAAAAQRTALPLPAPLATIQQPALWVSDANGADTTTPATFQGFTSFGQYVYMLDGAPRPTGDTGPATGAEAWAIHTTSMDLNGTQNGSQGYIDRTHSAADISALPREPEGMAVYTGSGTPRLAFAITNNSSDGTRRFDLYYKS